MTHITCRLSAKNRDQLRKPTLGNRVWATFTFYLLSLSLKFVACLLVRVRVAEAPSNLRHFFVVESRNITANVSWKAPLSDLPITAYQISWGRLNSHSRRTLHLSKVLPSLVKSVAETFY